MSNDRVEPEPLIESSNERFDSVSLGNLPTLITLLGHVFLMILKQTYVNIFLGLSNCVYMGLILYMQSF
ncbi:hypothetical protein P153DRAFT_371454 [Dothidotthia symphoricarpi CBS 119687]|uniref:Uncharacterized protein n=1 Tax=Dothidotthia symphoricarpi CBS 119687 TaxID=1392245 RepID=A0A6A5ZZP0_9PLEO|nr:uncharacterized protein P153DRAFT_371454 [Dothidotthia symphoricarpi CBS 119687]KAF2123791.1 hypothetical protein P153DRAFT_371454 [Dothidotthia symphoricarpi CBS 119687]